MRLNIPVNEFRGALFGIAYSIPISVSELISLAIMHGFSEILTLHGSTNTHPGIKNCKGFIHSSEKNDTALYLDISYKLYHAILVQLWIGILNWSSWIRSDNTTSNWTLDIPKIFFWSEIILISSVSRKSTKCIWVELGFWVELSTIQNFSGLCGMRPTFQFSKSKKIN